MKLKKLHVFLLLLLSLMFCCLGFSVVEGLTENEKDAATDEMNKGADNETAAQSDSQKVGVTSEGRLQLHKEIMWDKDGNNLLDPWNNDPKKKILPGRSRILPGVPTPNSSNSENVDDDDDDLYILKSQIVPPVCPKCPDVKRCDTTKDCPACPAPKRCPPKPFECKMVPKWSDPRESKNGPRPILNSFDTFA